MLKFDYIYMSIPRNLHIFHIMYLKRSQIVLLHVDITSFEMNHYHESIEDNKVHKNEVVRISKNSVSELSGEI